MTFDWTSGHNMLEVDMGILRQKLLALIHNFDLACKDIELKCIQQQTIDQMARDSFVF